MVLPSRPVYNKKYQKQTRSIGETPDSSQHSDQKVIERGGGDSRGEHEENESDSGREQEEGQREEVFGRSEAEGEVEEMYEHSLSNVKRLHASALHALKTNADDILYNFHKFNEQK